MALTTELRGYQPRSIPTDPKQLPRFIAEELRAISLSIAVINQALKELDDTKVDV